MLIGYARVSTGEQETAAQVVALKAAGCELIFREKASGGRWDRPELHKLLSQLRKGDVLVVWKPDRLSRSLRDVAHNYGAGSGEESRFSQSHGSGGHNDAAGRMMKQMVGAFADYAECTIMRSHWPKWHSGLHISGLGLRIIPRSLPTYTRVHALGCEGLSDEDPSPQARQAWLRTV